jgi:hypothetical protein
VASSSFDTSTGKALEKILMELSLLRNATRNTVQLEAITPSKASAKATDTADFFAKLDMATVPQEMNEGKKYVLHTNCANS